MKRQWTREEILHFDATGEVPEDVAKGKKKDKKVEVVAPGQGPLKN